MPRRSTRSSATASPGSSPRRTSRCPFLSARRLSCSPPTTARAASSPSSTWSSTTWRAATTERSSTSSRPTPRPARISTCAARTERSPSKSPAPTPPGTRRTGTSIPSPFPSSTRASRSKIFPTRSIDLRRRWRDSSPTNLEFQKIACTSSVTTRCPTRSIPAGTAAAITTPTPATSGPASPPGTTSPPAAGTGTATWRSSPAPRRSPSAEDALLPRGAQGAEENQRKARILDQIAARHPARLLRQAKEPLQPRALHPARRAAHGAGDEIERSSQAERDRRPQRVRIAVAEALLLGEAQRDDQQMRPRLAHALENVVGRAAVAAHHRRIDACDDHALALQPVRRGARYLGPGTEEIDAPFLARRALHEWEDQIAARHFLRQGRAQKPRGPHQRHAVRQGQARGCVGLARGGVAVHLDHVVEVWLEDRAALGSRTVMD